MKKTGLKSSTKKKEVIDCVISLYGAGKWSVARPEGRLLIFLGRKRKTLNLQVISILTMNLGLLTDISEVIKHGKN